MGNEESTPTSNSPRPASAPPVRRHRSLQARNSRSKMTQPATAVQELDKEEPKKRSLTPKIVTTSFEDSTDDEQEEGLRRANSASPSRGRAKFKAVGAIAGMGAAGGSESSKAVRSELKSFQLTNIQTRQIQKLWLALTKAKGMGFAGSMIFEKIFIKERKTRDVFMAMGGNFRYHYLKFAETLDFVIKNLTSLNVASDRLEELGQLHTNFRNAGFNPRMWDTFAESMIACTVQWGNKNQRTPETQKGWTKIVLFIIDRMRDGYHKRLRRGSMHGAVSLAAQLALPGIPAARSSNTLSIPTDEMNVNQAVRAASFRGNRTTSVDQGPKTLGMLVVQPNVNDRRKSTY